MIAKTLGGGGPTAQDVFRTIAKDTAESSSVEESVGQLYEGLGMRLQRANTRKILSWITAAMAAGRNNTALATTSSEAALVLSAAAVEAAA